MKLEKNTLLVFGLIAVIIIAAAAFFVLSQKPMNSSFYISVEKTCTIEGKPVVFMFSTSWCRHCNWVKEAFDEVAKEYVSAGKISAYHWQLDTEENPLVVEQGKTIIPEEHLAIFNRFSPKALIPAYVFGCRYYRIGNAFEAQNDIEAEKQEFRKIIDDMLSDFASGK